MHHGSNQGAICGERFYFVSNNASESKAVSDLEVMLLSGLGFGKNVRNWGAVLQSIAFIVKTNVV